MVIQIRKPEGTRAIGNCLLLAAVQALLWLYGHCIIQYVIFRGLGAAGTDYGLGTVLLGAAWSIISATLVALVLANKILGQRSWATFIVSGILGLPIAVLFTSTAPNPPTLSRIFWLLGLGGQLTEGRHGLAGANAWWFLVIFYTAVTGYLFTYRTRLLPGLLMGGILLLGGFRAYAYDIPSHQQFLTIEAVTLLNKASDNGYGELSAQAGNLTQATGDEDALSVSQGQYNSLMHFYRPTDQSPLTAVPFTVPNAKQRLAGSDFNVIINPSPNGIGFFENAVKLYKQGQKTQAYTQLGHALHLATQDMFSPPHVNDDAHIYFDLGLWDFVPDSYEPWVAQHYNYIEQNAFHNAQGPQRLPNTQSAYVTLHNNAAATYRAVRIPGTLNQDLNNPASGPLAAMFAVSNRVVTTCVPEQGICVNTIVWSIPGAGDCGQDCAAGNPANNEHWWLAQNFSGETGQFYYFENPATLFPTVYKDGSATGGKALVELWALDKEGLIAKSQAASAGLLAEFAYQVDHLKPTIEVFEENSAHLIKDGGQAGGPIVVRATDPTDPNNGQPVASGIYRVILTKVAGGTVVSPDQPSNPHGDISVEQTFSNLKAGQYLIRVYDGLGNKKQQTFFIRGVQASAASCNTEFVNITGTQTVSGNSVCASASISIDAPSGISQFSFSDPTALACNPPNPVGATHVTCEATGLKPGDPTLIITDSLQQQTQANWGTFLRPFLVGAQLPVVFQSLIGNAVHVGSLEHGPLGRLEGAGSLLGANQRGAQGRRDIGGHACQVEGLSFGCFEDRGRLEEQSRTYSARGNYA